MHVHMYAQMQDFCLLQGDRAQTPVQEGVSILTATHMVHHSNTAQLYHLCVINKRL